MTNEEAIARIKTHMVIHKMEEPRAILISEALEMAIKALEQQSTLDKIKAEIEEVDMNITYQENKDRKASWGLRKALEIIDKYTESEDKNESRKIYKR